MNKVLEWPIISDISVNHPAFGMAEKLKIHYPAFYTRGQVSVNKRNSVLSNYFDVSFEIYYVRLKYIDSIGQVVKLLILRPAPIYCTFKPGHIGSLER